MNNKQRISQKNDFLLNFVSEIEKFSSRESYKGILTFYGVTWQKHTKQRIFDYLSNNMIIDKPSIQNHFINDLNKEIPQYTYILKMDLVNDGIWTAIGTLDDGKTFYELGVFPL